jgi:hypothetical protein
MIAGAEISLLTAEPHFTQLEIGGSLIFWRTSKR